MISSSLCGSLTPLLLLFLDRCFTEVSNNSERKIKNKKPERPTLVSLSEHHMSHREQECEKTLRPLYLFHGLFFSQLLEDTHFFFPLSFCLTICSR